MKRTLFIMTHPEANLTDLTATLEGHPNVSCFSTGNSYHHPDDLALLTDLPHKKKNSAAIWADAILHNKDFTCRALIGHCNFIFWVENPTEYRLDGLKRWYAKGIGPWNPTSEEIYEHLEGFSS
jgi:hypothetical protein